MTNTMRSPVVKASNPLQSSELQGMLKELDTISDPGSFQRWRTSFLQSFEAMLDTDGIEKAREADSVVLKKMPSLDRTINNVRSCVRNGHICVDKQMGVKGQTAVNKLKEGCIDMEKRLQLLVPGSSAEAQAVGYNKFQLGAVLVKDGFKIYVYLVRQEAILKELKVSVLEKVEVDRQIIDSVSYYLRQIRSLCDVMADLELFDVMVKTRELAGDKLFAKRTKSIVDEQRESVPRASESSSKSASVSPSTVVDLLSSIDHAKDNETLTKLPILDTRLDEDPGKRQNEETATLCKKKTNPDCTEKSQPKVNPRANSPPKVLPNDSHRVPTNPKEQSPKDKPTSAAVPNVNNKYQTPSLEEGASLAERQRRVLSEQEKLAYLEESASETKRNLASQVAKNEEDEARKAIMAKRAKRKSKKTPKAQEPTTKTKDRENQHGKEAAVAKVKEDQPKELAAKAIEEQQMRVVAAAKAKEEEQKQAETAAAAAKAKEEEQKQATAAKAKEEQQKQAAAAAAAKEEQQKQAAKAKEERQKQAVAAAKAKVDEQNQAATKAKEEQQKEAAAKAKEQHQEQAAAAAAAAAKAQAKRQKQASTKVEEERQEQAEAAAKENAKPKSATKPAEPKRDEERPKTADEPLKPQNDESKPKPAAKAKPEDDGKDDDFLIFFDPKTQSMGKLDKRKCIELGIITMNPQGGTESIEENLADEDKLPLMRMIAKSMKRVLGNKK